MNFPIFIAKRYLFSKKSHNVINIISMISIFGIASGTFALIVVLSVYNGFENLIQSLYGAFDPDLRITIAEGKYFDPTQPEIEKIKTLYPKLCFVETIEENVLLKYGDKMQHGIIKGVDENFIQSKKMDSLMVKGEFILSKIGEPYAVIGQGLTYYLELSLNFVTPIITYAPNAKASDAMDPENAFTKKVLFPSGIFKIQPEIDSKYLFASLNFTRELTGQPKNISSLDVLINKNENTNKIQEEIEWILGPEYVVKNKFQQHELLYKIMKSEKFAIYAILAFILLIASFNVITSISMLIIDKTHDMAILQSMGLDLPSTRKIFFFQGIFVTIGGTFIGIVLGGTLSYLQMQYKFIKMAGAENLIIEHYPVVVEWVDLGIVLIIVCCIGLFASWYPVKWMTRKFFSIRS